MIVVTKSLKTVNLAQVLYVAAESENMRDFWIVAYPSEGVSTRLYYCNDATMNNRMYETLINDWCLGRKFFDVKTNEKRILDGIKEKENE